MEVTLITPEKIEAWKSQVEANPSSAPTMIEFIARRLTDLTRRNEELLAENIALRLEHKVEDYERRIANLEYQLDLLKRQLSGTETLPAIPVAGTAPSALPSLIFYQAGGQVLRLELDVSILKSGVRLPSLSSPAPNPAQSELDALQPMILPRLLPAGSQEELLFIFDSGRVQALPVQSLPAASLDSLEWKDSFLVEPRGVEELVSALPIARMSLVELCIQASRRGCVKKLQESFFENCVRNGYVGTGVKLPTDKTCDLVLCNRNDLLVLVSQHGSVRCLQAGQVPFTIEEALRLGPLDHLVSVFKQAQKTALLFVTANGKALYRESSWLEPASSFKVQAQSILSSTRRDAGAKIIGAAAVNEQDWGIALDQAGQLIFFTVSDLFSTGILPTAAFDLTAIAIFPGDQPDA
jgi:hypothetical protein